MSDKLIAAAASIDWVSPLLTIIGNIVNGPSYTFLVPYSCGWSGRAVVSLLRRYGIKSWGHMVVDDTLMLNVRQAQAGWAQHVLDQAGVPVENPAAASSPSASASRPRLQTKRSSTQGEVATTAKSVWEMRLF